jgi:hypothetical protein
MLQNQWKPSISTNRKHAKTKLRNQIISGKIPTALTWVHKCFMIWFCFLTVEWSWSVCFFYHIVSGQKNWELLGQILDILWRNPEEIKEKNRKTYKIQGKTKNIYRKFYVILIFPHFFLGFSRFFPWFLLDFSKECLGFVLVIPNFFVRRRYDKKNKHFTTIQL